MSQQRQTSPPTAAAAVVKIALKTFFDEVRLKGKNELREKTRMSWG